MERRRFGNRRPQREHHRDRTDCLGRYDRDQQYNDRNQRGYDGRRRYDRRDGESNRHDVPGQHDHERRGRSWRSANTFGDDYGIAESGNGVLA